MMGFRSWWKDRTSSTNKQMSEQGMPADSTLKDRLHSSLQENEEIKARIRYHYPKRDAMQEQQKYKQPIQNEEGRPRKRRIRENTIAQSPKGMQQEKSSRRKQRAAQSQQMPQKEFEVKPAPEKDSEQVKPVFRPSRPFQPTEIPSPIYGFKKRPGRTTSSWSSTCIDEENSVEESLRSLSMATENDEPDISLQIQQKEVKSESVSLPINTPSSEKQRESFSFEEEPESVVKQPYHRISIENGLDSSESVVPATYLESEGSDEEVATISNSYQDTDAEEEAPSIEDSPSVEESSTDNKEEDPPRKRSHLPFNVLMLKQDKTRYEAQEQRKKEQAMNASEVAVADERHFIESSKNTRRTQDATIDREFMHHEEEVSSTKQWIPPQNDELDTWTYTPALSLLQDPIKGEDATIWAEEQALRLQETLSHFHVKAKVVDWTQGPSVTRFEIQPEPGVKVSKITNLLDDLKLNLAAEDIRLEAPIPGKQAIGVEIPNASSRPVVLKEVLGTSVFRDSTSPLTVALGVDLSGAPIVTDLAKMPHGLIAGATGSGKSVCINSMLISLLYKAQPHEVNLLLIDPKVVELAPYNGLPHLVSPVITDVKAATAALKWAVEEMERRYELFAHARVRDVKKYNELCEKEEQYSHKLPYLVIVIDELADLMMMAPNDVEEAICRIAQKARACGIHLLLATQRPSVDVITGLIKANVPTRLAFSVSSQVDSRTILDRAGAERLLGRGDMLFVENGSSKLVRMQGTFVTDDEIEAVVKDVSRDHEPNYLFQQEELLQKIDAKEAEDDLFEEVCAFVVKQQHASTSLIQRQFRVGYNRAARLVDLLELQGIVSEAKGSKPRDVLMTKDELASAIEE